MKRVLISIVLLLSAAVAFGQANYGKANQAYVMYESERDKGTNIDLMYTYLVDSYKLFAALAEDPSNTNIEGTKNRLRAMYPALLNGAIYYSDKRQPQKGLDCAAGYIDIPQLKVFRTDLFQRDAQYPSVVYYAATSAYALHKRPQAIKYFNEFLSLEQQGVTLDEGQVKSSYVYLNMIYNSQKDYAEQEKILEKAAKKYPVSLDFLYNLVNVHIATNNMAKLVNTIDRILAIDPNNTQVLPIKARIMEKQGNNEQALEAYGRLYAMNPNSIEIISGLARANFNIATKIVNEGATIADDAQYAVVRQRASQYLMDAHDLFIKILQAEPTSVKYMQGLAGVYQFMDMDSEYEVMKQIINEGASYTTFSDKLTAYNAQLKQSNLASTSFTNEAAPIPTNPAQLVIKINDIIDGNGNKNIDAGEHFEINFTITNNGLGDAYNLRIRISEQQGYDMYFEGPRELDGGNILAGQSKDYKFSYIVKEDMPTAVANIDIFAFEANGFDADPAHIVMNTEELAIPRLRVADYQFFAEDGTSITIGKNGKLTLAIQNYGTKEAKNVKLQFKLPDNVFNLQSEELVIESIGPGEVKTIDYGFVVNKRFIGDSIAVVLAGTESTRSTYINDAYKVKLGEYLTASSTLNIQGAARAKKNNVQDFQIGLDSELLENVPRGGRQSNRYALIIGNEDYSMTGGNAEINVPFAINDALVFQEYCLQTFGIPKENITFVPNATTGLMHEKLDWLINMAKTDPNAELFFYYSGHGSAEEATKEAYLLPCDLTGKNVKFGIALKDLYDQLGQQNIKGAYVFLDACFSGGYKSNAPIIAQKGVRVVPKKSLMTGNVIAFSSSSGDQTSSVYREKKHGYYTYFLLKCLRDANGNISLEDLFLKTNAEVRKATAKINKIQEPQHMVSPTWSNWNTSLMASPSAE